jgi:hypothetical protein
MTTEIISPDLIKEQLQKEKPATVTELLAIAEKLYTKLLALNQLEDPAAILEEVIAMPDDKESIRISAGGRTYFLDSGRAKNDKAYLKITETHLEGEERKSVRNTVIIFEEQLKEFYMAFSRLVVKLKRP